MSNSVFLIHFGKLFFNAVGHTALVVIDAVVHVVAARRYLGKKCFEFVLNVSKACVDFTNTIFNTTVEI